jgi:hypothetical protein
MNRAVLRAVLITVTVSVLVYAFVNPAVHRSAQYDRVVHVWTTQDSKAYANDAVNTWAHKQYVCLASLWGKESAWKHDALNPEKVMGKHAGGIPQLLGMSPTTPPTEQIDRGLAYINYRYITPCRAWAFHKKNGWY